MLFIYGYKLTNSPGFTQTGSSLQCLRIYGNYYFAAKVRNQLFTITNVVKGRLPPKPYNYLDMAPWKYWSASFL